MGLDYSKASTLSIDLSQKEQREGKDAKKGAASKVLKLILHIFQ